MKAKLNRAGRDDECLARLPPLIAQHHGRWSAFTPPGKGASRFAARHRCVMGAQPPTTFFAATRELCFQHRETALAPGATGTVATANRKPGIGHRAWRGNQR